MDHLVDIEEGDQQALEQMKPVAYLAETEFESPAYCLETVLEPLLQHLAQVLDLGPAVDANHVEVDAVGTLEIGRGKQVRHHPFDIDTVGTGHDHETRRVLVIGFITQVLDPGQLLVAHLRGDLLKHTGTGNLVGKLIDDHFTLQVLPAGSHAHRSVAALVDLQQFIAWRDDLCPGRVVGTQYVFAELGNCCLRLLDETNTGRGYFTQVVRRNVRRHTDGNTCRTVEQDIGNPGRQGPWLLHGAVEVGLPFNRSLAEFAEQQFGVG